MARSPGVALVAILALAAWLTLQADSSHRPDETRGARAEAPRPAGPPRAAPALREPRPVLDSRREAHPPEATDSTETSETHRLEASAVPGPAPHRGPVRVHGRVRRGGRPVADYDLSFHLAGGGLADDGVEWDFTDDEGRYEVVLPPARYLVLNGEQGPFRTDVVVPPGEPELQLDLDLPAGRVRGRVVHGEAGWGARGARVYALRADPGAADAVTEGLLARAAEARTDAGGAFELADLEPGPYLLVARLGDALTVPLPVEARPLPAGDVLLDLGTGYALEGVVRDAAGRPAALELRVYPRPGVRSLAQPLLARRLESDAHGRFTARGLAPGSYRIHGAGTTEAGPVALWASVELEPGDPPFALTAVACGGLRVTVCRPDGSPVPDALLDLRTPGGEPAPASLTWLERGASTGGGGRLELDDVLPGRYLAAPVLNGRRGRSVPVRVRSGETAALRLVLD